MNRRPVVHMSRVTPFYNVISAFFQTHGACRQCDQILRIFATLAIFGRFIQYLTKLWACYGKLFMLLAKYSLLQRAKNQKNNVFVWSHFGCRDRLAIKQKHFFIVQDEDDQTSTTGSGGSNSPTSPTAESSEARSSSIENAALKVTR